MTKKRPAFTTRKPPAKNAETFIKGASTVAPVEDEKPSVSFSLRLTPTQLEQLRELAKRDDRSMQKTALRYLFSAVKSELGSE